MEQNEKTLNFIEKAKIIHGNKYDYSKVNYMNTHTKIIIICSLHNEFEQTPYCHINSYGCHICAEQIRKGNINKTTEIFIKKANSIHNNKYDYSKVNYVNYDTHITITCKIHGDFTKTPTDHYKGWGCNECSKEEKFLKDRMKFKEDFIQKANKVHNNKYDYSNINYINNKTEITLNCSVHGEFKQTPFCHLITHGCQKCALIEQGLKRKLTQEDFITRAKLKHGDKYIYDNSVYKGADELVKIICKIHGEFEQLAISHTLGKGCQKCGSEKGGLAQRNTLEDYIEQAHMVHKNKYDYSKVEYKDSHTKIIILCPKHGPFRQAAGHHLRGYGCIKCIMCPECLLWRTYGKLCEYCKPKDKNEKYKKTKEYKAVNYLRENLPDKEFIHNRSLGNECTNTRIYPDIRFDCEHYNLIVEIDEFKHRGAEYACDKKRMYDIIAKLGTPCIFIRYNPDNKQSKLETLLETVNEYLDLDIDDNNFMTIFDEYGFKAEYLYY